ncbi:CHAP domain-containing protein [Kitasatospora sp. NPDC097643]|uniref:CHAP domain-containing protein n=1 Tax=Kitasatospora sp. NPDC097643 TaxID=3157230 RepID=UPI003328C822
MEQNRHQAPSAAFKARAARTVAAVLVVTGVLGTGVAGATALPAGSHSASQAVVDAPATRASTALRDRIVSVARGEIGVREGSAECNKYFPNKEHTCKTGWCAAFVEWTWREAGVKDVPSDLTGRGVGHWGRQHDLWHPVGSAHPKPGDLVVYGEPAKETPGGHVGVVVAVNGDGTLDTVEGNYNDKVTLRTHISPKTAIGGRDGLHVSGYVTPPGA